MVRDGLVLNGNTLDRILVCSHMHILTGYFYRELKKQLKFHDKGAIINEV